MLGVRVKTLRRAAEIVGGEEALALLLGVTPSHLALWLRGAMEPPDRFFLRAVDIVLEIDSRPMSSAAEAAAHKSPEETTK
jgi:transcriptional regulator with XRE-family HTH domain